MAHLPRRAPRRQLHYTAVYYLGNERIGTDVYTKEQRDAGSADPIQLIMAKATALGYKIMSNHPSAIQYRRNTVRYTIEVEIDSHTGTLHLNWS